MQVLEGARCTQSLGRDVGGVQKLGGGGNVPENASSRKFLDPSKRASGLLCRGFFYTWWHVSPQRFASDSASQKFRRDTVRVSCATWAHESQRFLVTRIAA